MHALMSANDPKRTSMLQLFGIDLNVPRPRLVEKDEYQGVAGLGPCIAALARYLSGHAARILCNHLTEAITLDGDLLSGFDLVVESDQMLNEPARGGQDRERAVTDKDSHVLACTSHWPGHDAVMLENVHCAFHEERDLLGVQDARSADFRREGRDAHVHKRVVQDTGIYMIVEDLADGIELHHRLDLGHIHAANIECGDFESGCPRVEVDREVGVRPQQAVEQKPGVSAGCGGAVLVPGPLPIHID